MCCCCGAIEGGATTSAAPAHLRFIAPAAGGFGGAAIQAAASVAEAAMTAGFARSAATATAPFAGDQLSRLRFEPAAVKGPCCAARQGDHPRQHQPETCQRSSQSRIHLPTPLQPSS